MGAKKKRLTLLLEPEAQRRLQDAAARQGVSVQDLCRSAIDNALDKFAQDADGAAKPHFDIEAFIALQKQTFGDRVLPGSSVDLIHEAREERDRQMESW